MKGALTGRDIEDMRAMAGRVKCAMEWLDKQPVSEFEELRAILRPPTDTTTPS